MFSKAKVLLIEFIQMPRELQDVIVGWVGFSNDCLIPVRSEFSPIAGEDRWSSNLSRANLEEYWKQQNFEGTLEEFIVDYGLQVDYWLIQQVEAGKLDLEGIDDILINVCW